MVPSPSRHRHPSVTESAARSRPNAGKCHATSSFFVRPITDIHRAPALFALHVAHDAGAHRSGSNRLRASPVRVSQVQLRTERSRCERPYEIGFRGVACRGTQGTDVRSKGTEHFRRSIVSQRWEWSGVMCDGNQARANLQEKLEQARRLLQQISDPTTTESLKAFIADLENRLRNLLDPE